MQENYNHYIAKSIRKLYRKRLIGPVLYLIFAGFLWIMHPISSIVFPTELKDLSDMGDLYNKNDTYVSATLSSLNFTGYTKTRFHRTIGYYYYVISPDKKECRIILLSPSSCEEGRSSIDQIQVYGKIFSADTNYESLLTNLSNDLLWTKTGIFSKVNPYYLSEPDFQYRFGIFLILFLLVSGMIVFVTILFYILFILKPSLSPPCRKLGHFGKPKELLALAEEELATLPQLATEDMFITEHFFIELSKYGIAIVPIEEIIWIYKHSTLQKLFWHHFRISYTLHITANEHVYIHCPKNTKSDIEGIMDYLAEANHNILVGFSEANRKKIHGAARKTRK